MSNNGIKRQNFENLGTLYFLKHLQLKEIKCPQKFDFPTLNEFFGYLKVFLYQANIPEEKVC